MNTRFPEVKFVFDQDHDADAAIGFIHNEKFINRSWFLKKFFPPHLHFMLGKNFSDSERRKIIRSYTSESYNRNKNNFKKSFPGLKSDWNAVKGDYFELVTRLFKNHPWPKGKYVGFSTIFWCYPRFISKKIFFVPIKHSIPHHANAVIAHEMLHFMFFDYVEKRYGMDEHAKIPGREPNYLWKASEAFNSVIEGWKPYQKIFNSQPKPYPETMIIYKKMEKQWRRKQDVDALLDSVLRA